MKEHTVEICMKVLLQNNEDIYTWIQDNLFDKEELRWGEVIHVHSKTAEEGAWILK